MTGAPCTSPSRGSVPWLTTPVHARRRSPLSVSSSSYSLTASASMAT
ncbi:hypothetical protein [Arthrobacter sp. TB 26]|nr:hypothetical protein [Arthrobacter sp. TB 26]